MNNQLYSALCQLEGANLAKGIYPALADSGLIPDDENILRSMFYFYYNSIADITAKRMASFMNVDLTGRLKTHLECNLVHIDSRDELKKALHYEEQFNADDPSKDIFLIHFQGKCYGPTVKDIEALCDKIIQFGHNVYNGDYDE